jgi:general secretion pathway protein G
MNKLTKPPCAFKAPPERNMKLAQRGFTLLELLVVIVIIGMLASYVGPKYFAQIGRSEVTVAKAQLEGLSKAVDTFRIDVGRYPGADEGLGVLMVKPDNATGWNGPYLKKEVPLDPWGHAYVYKLGGSAAANGVIPDYQIISMGKDGQPGGSGDDADLTSN